MTKKYTAGMALALFASGCAISQQQEVELGQQYSAEIAKQLPLVNDGAILGYLNTLGNSLARTADTRNLSWRFHLVDAKEVNAFAVPGGFIYINRGLVERTQNMSQLAGVLGHEIGHVTRRHSVQQMQKAQGTNIGVVLGCTLIGSCGSAAVQTGINVVGSSVFAKFSRDDEREADQEGVKTLVRAGINPNGMPEMFEILLAERRSRPDAVSALFATHPLEEERVANSRKMIAGFDPRVVRGLRSDEAAFQTFRRRVQSLPRR
jgi:beta-barrel assembly-enhancing protease